MKTEDEMLANLLHQIDDLKAQNRNTDAIAENIEKCRIRMQAYLRRLHLRQQRLDDFVEVILRAYDRFLELEREIEDITPRAERNKFAGSKLDCFTT